MRAAAALRLALMVDPALRVVDDLLKNKKHPIQHRLAAAKEVFDRNGLEAFGKPADPKTAIYQPPTQQTQVNVSTYHFEKLSEDELDFAERIFRSVIEAKKAEELELAKRS